MAVRALTAGGIAEMRRDLGLPADPASDQIWVNRLASASDPVEYERVVRELERRLIEKAGRTTDYPGGVSSEGFTEPSEITEPPGGVSGDNQIPPGSEGEETSPPTAEELAAIQAAQERENRRRFAERAQTLYPWMDPTLLAIFEDAYVDTGSVELAIGEVRNGAGKARYDEIFEGNRRPDGTLRYTESQYFGVISSYRDSLGERGLNPDLFEGRFGSLVAGEVSPREFESRVSAVEEQIVQAGDTILQAFTQAAGVEFTPEAAFASLLDPEIGDGLLKRRISIAEVRGEAARFGFQRSIARGGELVDVGEVTRQQAAQFFSEAGRQVSAFDRFARQFGAPDSDVDITELESAVLLRDPLQRQRLQRLQRQAASQFSPAVGVAGTRLGRLEGLRNR